MAHTIFKMEHDSDAVKRLEPSDHKKDVKSDALESKSGDDSRSEKSTNNRKRTYEEVLSLEKPSNSKKYTNPICCCGKSCHPHQKKGTENSNESVDSFHPSSIINTSESEGRTPNSASIISPPYSSTMEKPSHLIFDSESPSGKPSDNSNGARTLDSRRRSFGLKRKGIPSPLNMNAINLDRQFSGPFSANPLLRSHGLDSRNSSPMSGDKSHEAPTEKQTRLIPKEPITANESLQTPRRASSKPVTLPLISEMVTAAYISPSRVSAPVSMASKHPSDIFDSRFSPPRVSKLGPPIQDIPTRESLGQNSSAEIPARKPSTLRSDSSQPTAADDPRRRDRFLKLCGELWDLIH